MVLLVSGMVPLSRLARVSDHSAVSAAKRPAVLIARPPEKRPHALAPAPPIALPATLKIPRYRQGIEPFRDGETLVYEASWEGIPAAVARISLVHNRLHPDRWTGQIWITSGVIVDQLYRMRDYVREDFDYNSWRPASIHIVQHEKRRQDDWLAIFDAHARMVTATRRNRAGRTWIRRFSGGDPWGPFSATMLALSQPLAPGRTYTFDVFSGGNRYVFAFAVRDRERIATAFGTLPALRIEPSVAWLSEGSFRQQVHATTIWVSDDPRHLPLRVESAVFVGSVVVNLTGVVDAPESAQK
jgi:hypothetical protein